MKNPAKSIAKGLLRLTSPRAPIQTNGEAKEFVSNNVIKPIQRQTNALVEKVWSGEDAITKSRAKSIKESSLLAKPYRFLTEAGGTAVDSMDRVILEEGLSTASDAAHTLTGIGIYGLGKITGVKTTTNFQSRDYISTSNLGGNTFDTNRFSQLGQGVWDIGKGLFYGEANERKDAKGYRASTGVLGLAKTIAVDSWSQGVTQTFQNVNDSLFASANRTVSGFKNAIVGGVMIPFWGTDYLATKTGEFLVPKAKAKISETDFRSFIPFGFNPSNFNEVLDEEEEFKTYWQRTKSVFRKDT